MRLELVVRDRARCWIDARELVHRRDLGRRGGVVDRDAEARALSNAAVLIVEEVGEDGEGLRVGAVRDLIADEAAVSLPLARDDQISRRHPSRPPVRRRFYRLLAASFLSKK